MPDFSDNLSEKTVSLAEISEFLTLGERRVQQLAAMGVVKKAGKGQYYLKLSVQNYITFQQQTKQSGETLEGEEDQGLLYDRAKARHELAKAEKAEMELGTLRLELVPASDVAKTWNKIIEILKKRLMNLPTDLAPLIVSIKTTQDGHTLVMKHIRQILQELADTDVIYRSDGASDTSEAI